MSSVLKQINHELNCYTRVYVYILHATTPLWPTFPYSSDFHDLWIINCEKVEKICNFK
jgi:hypothetical protein